MLWNLFKPKLKANRDSDDLMQQIGLSALAAAHDPNGKVLLYAEAEEGVISADVFSQAHAETVRFRFAPENLKAMLYQLWEETPEDERWATMAFVIEAGRFDCSLGYPYALDGKEDLAERRARAVAMIFGDAKVDYSAPR